MRIAVIDKDLCKPEKCGHECIKVCPVNRTDEKCVFLSGSPEKSSIDEELCIGCGLCVKKCPFQAIQVVNTPEKLKEDPIHRFGVNQFVLFRLPFPVKGEVVGLLGQNAVGKTTALKLLSGEIKPNLGKDSAELKDLIKIFRGTELQSYLENLNKEKIKTIVKPQQIDVLSKVKGTVSDILEKYNEKGEKENIIKKLQLEVCLNRKLSQLSGGELQRVAIGIAASRKADIYYIDEPSSYLDVFQRLQTAKLIRELSKEASVVVVEHDLATLDFLADRIHIFYGVPGAYGIVSKPYSTRVGINTFLEGFVKEDNVRIRSEPIVFGSRIRKSSAKPEIYLQWSDISVNLNGFSLKVKKGDVMKSEILGIFGSNALGKTTFAKILSGELKPDSGEITKTVNISYKPQYITTDFKGTVLDLLKTVTDNPHSDEYRSLILRPLELERLLENNVSNLSGGELQRVVIALCLSKEADIYLLDEPSAYLDSEQRLRIAKLIQNVSDVRECSVMVIDHDLLFLSYLADRAMVFSGKPGEKGIAEKYDLQEGFNKFLKEVDVTFRKDPQTGRPRANKTDSQKDKEQKESGKYFYID